MRFAALPLGALLLAGCLHGAVACGYHPGLSSDTFDVVHPQSLTVAVAVNRALRAGLIEPPPAKPALPTLVSLEYRQAVDELRGLQERLDQVARGPDADEPLDMSLVFVASRLWTEYTLTNEGAEARVHVPAAALDKLVVLTDEAVLAALLSGRLSVDDALGQRLLVIVNDPGDRAASALHAAFSLSPAADPGPVVAN